MSLSFLFITISPVCLKYLILDYCQWPLRIMVWGNEFQVPKWIHALFFLFSFFLMTVSLTNWIPMVFLSKLKSPAILWMWFNLVHIWNAGEALVAHSELLIWQVCVLIHTEKDESNYSLSIPLFFWYLLYFRSKKRAVKL